jgi:hypothetical protein
MRGTVVMQSVFFITYLLSLTWETNNMTKRIGLNPFIENSDTCPTSGLILGVSLIEKDQETRSGARHWPA